MQIPRNEPCPCLSGKKYKKCCISKELAPIVTQAQEQPVVDQVAANALYQKCLNVLDLISQESLDQANLEQAKVLAEGLLLAHPEDDYVNLVQGVYQIKVGDLPQAIVYLQKAIAVYPLFAEAYYHLGYVYLQQDDLVNTVSCLNQVRTIEAIDARNPELLQAANDMLASLAEYTKKEFGCSLETQVKFLSLIQRAETCLQAGKHKKALELYQQVVAVRPTCVEAYENLGMLYYQAGQKEQAMACLTQVFTLNPDKVAQYMAQESSPEEQL